MAERYTLCGKEADKVVHEDMKKIVRTILDNVDDVVAIILFGGFGKGEGSVEIKDGKITPLNDYDMYMVSKTNKSDHFMRQLSKKCSNAIGREGLIIIEYPDEKYTTEKFFHVDLRNMLLRNLKKLRRTQRTFELKYSSKVVYGDKNILKLIPDVELPYSEALRLLFNKQNHLMTVKDSRDIIREIYCMKTFQDCCVSLLILDGKFNPTYVGRNKIFQKLDYPEELKKFVDIATKTKERPVDFSQLRKIKNLWEKAEYWTNYCMKKVLEKMLDEDLDKKKWDYIAGRMYKILPYTYFAPYLPSKNLFFLQYYLNIRFTLECWKRKLFTVRPLLNWKDSGLILGIATILYMNGDYRGARRYLKKIVFFTKDLKKDLLKLYSIYYLQKIV